MNLFKLMATLGLDTSEYEEKAKKATEKGKRLGSAIGGSLAKGVKLLGAGMVAAGTAVAGVTAMAVKNYAEYEQLVGGVETLFGESADAIKNYAKTAYKDAGLSANDYMEQATSFSASLIQSLGGDTAAAAEYANKAIVDMSDNANKMGTDIGMIQNAYQGFAKQNYTMLDNLKLGYGGTKEEMKRLLADASAIAGVQFDLGNYADIIEAIHVMQEQMGIAGTTSKEASTTIQGSLGMVKSAWENLLTGLADKNANLGSLVGNFVDSLSVAAQNLIPIVEQALVGAGQLIEELVPVVMDRIPQLITEVLPKIVESGVNILQSLMTGIKENLPMIVETALQIINTLAQSLIELIPEIITAGTELLVSLMEGLAEHPDQIITTALQIIVTLVTGLLEAIPRLIVAAGKLIVSLVTGLIDHLPDIWEAAKEILQALIDSIGGALDAVMEAGGAIVQAIVDGIAAVWDQLVEWFNGLWDSLFGNRTVDVNVNGNSNGFKTSYEDGYSWNYDGSHANGLSYVPFDGYIAQLHKGERVLTAKESRDYNADSDRPINITIQSVLNGRILGEQMYKYSRERARAMG